MPHDINKDLRREDLHKRIYDAFYQKNLNAKVLSRTDYDTPEGKSLQQQDVDAILSMPDNREIKVSEKDRTKDYGDMLIEMYSIFPDTPGWMEDSEADYIAYFIINEDIIEQVYWINAHQLKDFYNSQLKSIELLSNEFRVLKSNFKMRSTRKNIFIPNLGIEATLIQAYNKPCGSDTDWYTESISIKYSDLQKFGIEIKKLL